MNDYNKSFNCLNQRVKKTQKFDPDNIFIEKAGKKINVQAWIDENTEECNIYKMIDKYHGVENIENKLGGIIGDLTEYKDLKDILEKERHAQNTWNNLPLEIRNNFGNDKYKFIKDGMNWAKNKQTEFENARKQQIENFEKNEMQGVKENG